MRTLTKLIILACLPLPALAQGSDNCASAQPISGPGTFAFDNSAATTDGQPNAACQFLNQDQIPNDVWFAWTASAPGSVTIATCGGTSVDTKLAVYDGAQCAAQTPLDCSEDSCGGLQSEVSFSAVSGGTYLVRIGTFPGAAGGTGTFSVSSQNGGGNNGDDCTDAITIAGEGIFPFNNAGANTDGLPDLLCDAFNSTQVEHDVWYRWTANASGTFDVTTCGGTTVDTKIAAYDGANCATGQPLACQDDSCASFQSTISFLAFAGQTYLLRIGTFPGAVGGNGTFDISLEGSNPGSTTSFCQTTPNSVGPGAVISSTGSLSVAANSFNLLATGSLPNGFGIFYYGAAEITVPFGDGVRCVGGGGAGTFRLQPAIVANGFGEAQLPLDFTAAPMDSGPGAVTGGSTWKFQWWYRDVAAGGSGFNLSNGWSVTFQP